MRGRSVETSADRRRLTAKGIRRAVAWVAGSWAVLAGVLLVAGIAEARGAVREIENVRADAEAVDLIGGRAVLDRAAERFTRSDRYLSNPLLGPLEHIPLLGEQIRAASTMADAGAEVLNEGAQVLGGTSSDLEAGIPSGADRVRFVERLARDLDGLQRAVRQADAGSGDGLVGPVRSAHRRFERQLSRADDALGDAVAATTALAELLEGPSSYLVLASNNAEMRIGSGMFLSAGHLEIRQGRMRLTGFEAAKDLVLDAEQAVAVPPEIERMWGWSHPGRDLRSLGLSAHFPDNARIAASIWEAAGRPEVDGVLALDVVALRDLLAATGPIRASGEELDAGDVVRHLLHDQYVTTFSPADNEERREELAGVASAVVNRLDAGGVRFEALGQSLRRSASGRHLLAWAEDRTAQQAWRVLGVAGEVGASSLALGLANIDASKLDQFVVVRTDIHVEEIGNGEAAVVADSRIVNRTPQGEPPYVLGPDGTPDYEGLLIVHLPESASDVGVEIDGPAVRIGGAEDPSIVVRQVELDQRQTVRIVVRFRVPAEVASTLGVVPTARVSAVDSTIPTLLLGDLTSVAPPFYAGD